MKYAVDTSVAIKTVVAEADSDKAIKLRDDYNNAVHDLIAPDLFPTEICNTEISFRLLHLSGNSRKRFVPIAR